MTKITYGIIAFIAGIILAILIEPFLYNQIKYLFHWSTYDRLKLTGNKIYFFSDIIYYISFAIMLVIFIVANQEIKRKSILINAIIIVTIFIISLIVITTIQANLILLKIRSIKNNEINYGLIIAVCAIMSIIPSLKQIIIRKKIKQMVD